MNTSTVGAWLKATTERLAQRSVAPEDARTDAELLLEHITGRNSAAFMARPEAAIDIRALITLEDLVQRCAADEPLAYIIGSREFWSMDFEVSPAVLIPRPDTELLVERALVTLDDDSHALVLDAGTGSGAVAVAIASETENPLIASDRFSQALEIARRNAALHLPPARIALFCGDWLDAVADASVGLLVSNPPYIAEGDAHLPALQAEPITALVAEHHGMAALERLIVDGKRVVQTGGYVLLEHGYDQAEDVRQLFTNAGYLDVATHVDLGGKERVTGARRS